MVLIAGPTASGKSALALALAERSGGVIINADSAQLYRDIPVLSAAPPVEDMAGVEHRLYGVLDGAKAWGAAHFARVARREVEAVHAEGKLPILVGGTGLYLRTLLDGIAPIPPIDPKVRADVREKPVAANHARLAEIDPQSAARLNPADTLRVARALEVAVSTGRTLGFWHERRKGGIGALMDLRPIILLPPRDWLYARCDQRFAAMMEEGAIEEVQALLARGLDPKLSVMRAIGVREISAYLNGEIDRDRAIAAGQQATRRYAKRQYTWFAHQPPEDWPRFAKPITVRAELVEALSFLQSRK